MLPGAGRWQQEDKRNCLVCVVVQIKSTQVEENKNIFKSPPRRYASLKMQRR
jgi:hypothetical protein